MSVRRSCLLSLALIGTCLATAAGAQTPAATTKASSTSLIWRGDVTTGNGVVTEVAKAWQKAGHGKIELQPFNTASGIDAVANGTADLAGSARGSDGSAQNAGLVFTPVAWDGLVVIVQASNPVNSLTLKQVHDIYFGRITNWSEVGGRNAPIDVYAVASPGDGVEYSLRHLLFGRGNQPVAAPRLYVNTRKLEEGVSLNPNGLGAAALSGIRGNAKLKAVAINGTPATAANVANGSYMLFTPLYLVTSPNSPKAAEAKAFLDFMESDVAKTALRKHSVLPYQDGLALVSADSSRRGKILAEVGARASTIAPTATPTATPVSAPGATYAAKAAVAPTSPATQAAKLAMEQRNAAAAATAKVTATPSDKTQLSGVRGSVAAVSVSSLARASSSALTVSEPANGTPFAKVTATTSQGAASASVAAAAVPAPVKPAAASKTYKVNAGDTLFSIARKHAIDVAQLRTWNHLKSDQLKLGQVLHVSRH